MQSKKIIDVFGIPIFLHWSILPMLALLLGINVFSTAPLLPLITYPSLLLIVTLHELGHCYAAKKLGIGVEKITLTGIGGIAQISTMSDTKREAVITLAGPLVNVIIGIVTFPFVIKSGLSNFEITYDFSNVFILLWIMNLVLLLFNLLPIYPMDGGRLWRCLVAWIFGEQKSFYVAKYTNYIVLGFIGWFGTTYNAYFMLIITLIMATAGITACNIEIKKYKFIGKLNSLESWKLLQIINVFEPAEKLTFALLKNKETGIIEKTIVINNSIYPIVETSEGWHIPEGCVSGLRFWQHYNSTKPYLELDEVNYPPN